VPAVRDPRRLHGGERDLRLDQGWLADILSGLKTLLETGSKLEITPPEPAEVTA
jgi:hypothetical protein